LKIFFYTLKIKHKRFCYKFN